MQRQRLIAQASILFESKMYDPGAELPTKNPDMVKAWLQAETAVWVHDGEQAAAEESETAGEQAAAEESENMPATKAEPKTAEPGISGTAVGSEASETENLVGKVPKTRGRKKA